MWFEPRSYDGGNEESIAFSMNGRNPTAPGLQSGLNKRLTDILQKTFPFFVKAGRLRQKALMVAQSGARDVIECVLKQK
jgi:hypothetical protein